MENVKEFSVLKDVLQFVKEFSVLKDVMQKQKKSLRLQALLNFYVLLNFTDRRT